MAAVGLIKKGLFVLTFVELDTYTDVWRHTAGQRAARIFEILAKIAWGPASATYGNVGITKTHVRGSWAGDIGIDGATTQYRSGHRTEGTQTSPPKANTKLLHRTFSRGLQTYRTTTEVGRGDVGVTTHWTSYGKGYDGLRRTIFDQRMPRTSRRWKKPF